MKRFWQLALESVRGSTRDFTEGHVGQAVVLLAIPMVIEMGMESLFAVVDVFFVSRLGADAVAMVGLTESLLTIVYTVAMGLGIGATAVVARRIGEKDEDGAARAAAQALASAWRCRSPSAPSGPLVRGRSGDPDGRHADDARLVGRLCTRDAGGATPR
jgi:hypothetical protein